MHEQKYMSHSDEEWFGKRSDHKTIKDVLGGPMGIRTESVKQYKRSKSKWKIELKDINKEKKRIYSTAKKSGSRRETKKTNKFRTRDPKKRLNDSSNYFSYESDSDYSLYSDSD